MQTRLITNKPYRISSYWEKLQKHSFLIRVLSLRELKIKYSKTFLGISWFFIQPLAVVTVYTVFFHNFIKLNTETIPYPAFVLTGLVLWYLLTGVVTRCSYGLVESAELLNKVSFPRIIVLLSKVIPVMLECLVLLLITFAVVLATAEHTGVYALTAFFYFIQTAVLSFAIGMLCSILVLKYRDAAHVIPFIINFAIWLTPVFYSVAIVPEQYRNLYRYANPLALSMEGMRNALFFNQGISPATWLLFLLSCVILLMAALLFIKFEKRIVENL